MTNNDQTTAVENKDIILRVEHLTKMFGRKHKQAA